jgi:hypothetical protein
MTWLARWQSVARTSITAATFVALFALTNLVVATRSAATRQAFMNWASTDLVNLRHHPVGAMIVSAFVAGGSILDWIALGLIGFVCAGNTVGNLRCAAVTATAHVVGTLVSEGILAVQIDGGAVPVTERTILDIGPSYVIVAALVIGIAYGRWPARVASALAFALLSPHLFVGLTRLDVSAVGHCSAILVSLLMGYALRRSWRARPEWSARSR